MTGEWRCPYCGEEMRLTRIGGGSRQRPAWICRNDEAEVVTDERGWKVRVEGAIHPPGVRVWTAPELRLFEGDCQHLAQRSFSAVEITTTSCRDCGEFIGDDY